MATIEEVIRDQSTALLDMPGVVGVGQGKTSAGLACVLVMIAYQSDEVIQSLPGELDGFPVMAQVTGEFHANAS
jgi:hypothetical protein